MRYDYTKWLIHFVRDRKTEQCYPDGESSIYDVENLNIGIKANHALNTIIRLGGILPGYSVREGRTTIYGGNPVICFTEMPIYSFAKYAKKRNKTDRISPYGIALLKTELYSAGGRPVIYGLTSRNPEYELNTTFKRIFKDNILPLKEQYRYVAYNPSGDKWIDWTHEREWRWVPSEDKHKIWCAGGELQQELMPVPGLPLFNGSEHGGYFSQVGIIVNNDEEAKNIQKILTGFYLAECNDYSSHFSKEVISNSFIILLENIIDAVESGKAIEAQTIEGLKKEHLYKPILINENTAIYKKQIIEAVEKSKIAGLKESNNYLSKHKEDKDSCGYANVVSYDVTNPIIQQMLIMEIASGPYDGEVLIHVNGNWPFMQSINYNEKIAETVCKTLNSLLGDIFYTNSKLD
jgi:hypothetical protein